MWTPDYSRLSTVYEGHFDTPKTKRTPVRSFGAEQQVFLLRSGRPADPNKLVFASKEERRLTGATFLRGTSSLRQRGWTARDLASAAARLATMLDGVGTPVGTASLLVIPRRKSREKFYLHAIPQEKASSGKYRRLGIGPQLD